MLLLHCGRSSSSHWKEKLLQHQARHEHPDQGFAGFAGFARLHCTWKPDVPNTCQHQPAQPATTPRNLQLALELLEARNKSCEARKLCNVPTLKQGSDNGAQQRQRLTRNRGCRTDLCAGLSSLHIRWQRCACQQQAHRLLQLAQPGLHIWQQRRWGSRGNTCNSRMLQGQPNSENICEAQTSKISKLMRHVN